MPVIKIVNQQLVFDSNPGLSILNNLISKEAPIHTICGGKGLCGCCRVKIIGTAKGTSSLTGAEKARLKNELIEQGWRLSCQTFTVRDLDIYLPVAEELDSHCSGK